MSQENHDRDDLQEDLDNEQEQQQEDQERYVKLPEGDHRKMKQSLAKANKEAEKSRKERNELREMLDRYSELGDPDDLAQRLSSGNEQQEQDSDERLKDYIPKSEHEKARKQLLSKQEEQTRLHEEALGQERQKFQKTLVERESIEAISKHGGKSKFLLPELTKSVQLVDSDGKYAFRVTDEDGELRFNDRGEPMSIEELVLEMREDSEYGFLFDAPQRSGAGVKNQGSKDAGADRAPRANKSKMNDSEKHAYIKKHGFEAYKKLSN